MRRIGIIASESTESEARVILNEGEEKKVRAEDLILIENRNEGKIGLQTYFSHLNPQKDED